MSLYPDIISVLGMFDSNWNLVSADIVVTFLPVVVVYL
jgi:ABC-type glycerol-3-phosphate transport system permease component